MVDFGLFLTYGLVIGGAAIALLLPFIKALMSNPKSLIPTGIGVAALLVVYLLGYLLADSNVTEKYAEYGVTEGSSQTIGGYIRMVYILIILCLAGIVYSEFINPYVKKK